MLGFSTQVLTVSEKRKLSPVLTSAHFRNCLAMRDCAIGAASTPHTSLMMILVMTNRIFEFINVVVHWIEVRLGNRFRLVRRAALFSCTSKSTTSFISGTAQFPPISRLYLGQVMRSGPKTILCASTRYPRGEVLCEKNTMDKWQQDVQCVMLLCCDAPNRTRWRTCQLRDRTVSGAQERWW